MIERCLILLSFSDLNIHFKTQALCGGGGGGLHRTGEPTQKPEAQCVRRNHKLMKIMSILFKLITDS